MAPDSKAPVLPVGVVGLVDVGRLIREVEQLQDALRSEALRSGAAPSQAPKMSLLLDQLVSTNNLDIAQESQRQAIIDFLKLVKKDAPRLHMSFSANPSAQFTGKLMTWLRQNIHPHTLLTIGLQPGIGAGCVLRSTNKYFDMSLSKSFGDKRDLLMQRLRAQGPA
ncbi:MAG: hypothetical protein WAQ24_02020 [Candidatus Saccharimonadales bacterium]